MKYFVLLLCSLAASVAQAQLPDFRPSAIRHFSKSVQKATESDTAFRDKLSILLPDFQIKLDRASSDSSAFDALVDATFLIQNSPANHAAWLSSIGVPRAIVPQLSDYALYRFTNRMKPDPRYPAGFLFGLRLFKPHGIKFGYCLVRLEKDGKIALTHYDDYGNIGYTVTGILKGNRVIADETRFANHFFFLEGVLGSFRADKIGFTYHACDRYGNYLQKPEPVFEDITASDMLRSAGVPEAEIKAAIADKRSHMPLDMSEGTPPSFPGGDEVLNNYLGKSIRYPAEATKNRKSGTVVVTFVVTAEGKVKDVRVKNKLGYGIDEEAIRVVSHMPDWIPGRLDDVPANVEFHLPIKFSFPF